MASEIMVSEIMASKIMASKIKAKQEYGDRHEVDSIECTIPMQQIYQRLNATPEQIAEFCDL